MSVHGGGRRASAPGPAPGHREVPSRLARRREAGRPEHRPARWQCRPAMRSTGEALPKPARRLPGQRRKPRVLRGRRVCFVAVWSASLCAGPAGPGRGRGLPAVARLRERNPLSARSPQLPLSVLCACEPGAIRGLDLSALGHGPPPPGARVGSPVSRRWVLWRWPWAVSPSCPSLPENSRLSSQRPYVEPSPRGISVATTRGIRMWPRGEDSCHQLSWA